MRNAFIRALLDVCSKDSRVLLLTGDLGFGVLDELRERFPSQVYNVGVAEQNLAGVAAGFALSGHTVFTYSIGNFPTLRCLEQVRNDICYHEANVKIVTVGGGMAYGSLGFSHFAIEDLAILRSLPGMTVVAPADPIEVERLVPQIVAHPGPVYLRLGRAGETPLHVPEVEVLLGQPTMARDGSDILLLSVGGMLSVALEAADALRADGVSAAVVSVHTVQPLDSPALCGLASRFPVVVTCEEHTVRGGLGGAVAEALLEGGVTPTFRRFGLCGFPTGVGSQEHLLSANQLDAASLRSLVLSLQVEGRQTRGQLRSL